jgi:hypothetical protein
MASHGQMNSFAAAPSRNNDPPPQQARERQLMTTIITIIHNSWIVMLAAAGLAVGAGMLGYNVLSGPPSRDSVQTVEGRSTEASGKLRKDAVAGSMPVQGWP